MGACGAAFEAVRWGDKHGLKMMLCDKAALERSGAVAQGLSAINTYLGKNTADDYVRMVRTDLMGLVREDLIFDVGRHVDDSVHLFEEWGLPCWIKDENGHNMNGAAAKAAGKSLRNGDEPVRSGRWQIMINGVTYMEKKDLPSISYAGLAETEITLKDNEYFVLGDNRNNSADSRYADIGNVTKSNIVGKVWFRVSPYTKLGFLR